MPEVIITVEAGAQSATLTIPTEAADRLQPMVESLYRPLAPADATLLRCFVAGLRHHLLLDLRRFERRAASWTPPDTTAAGEGVK